MTMSALVFTTLLSFVSSYYNDTIVNSCCQFILHCCSKLPALVLLQLLSFEFRRLQKQRALKLHNLFIWNLLF